MHCHGFLELSTATSSAREGTLCADLLDTSTPGVSDVDDQNFFEVLFGGTGSNVQLEDKSSEQISEEREHDQRLTRERYQSCLTNDRMVDSLSPGDRNEDEVRGIRLIHLLLAAAEAVSTRSNDLSKVILECIENLIVTSKSSTIERMALYLSYALRCRMHGVNSSKLGWKIDDFSSPDTLAGFRVLHEWTPYIKFSHFTANQAILEAVEGHERVHIVDYDIMDGSQWSSFMCSFASKHEKHADLHLSITAIDWRHGSSLRVGETGRRLSDFAASIHLSFTFNQINVGHRAELSPTAFNIFRGETLVANCMIHLPNLPYRAASSVQSFLVAMREIRPKLVAVVEEDLGCSTNVPFVHHFLRSLQHYSTLIDSLEASLTGSEYLRKVVENTFLAPSIVATVTFGGSFLRAIEEDSDDTGKHQWGRCFLRPLGFKCVPLSSNNYCQAKLLLSMYPEGFDAVMEEDRMLLRWHSRRLFGVSMWNSLEC